MRRRDALPRVRFSRRRRRVIVAAHYLLLAVLLVALPGASLVTSLPRVEVFGLIGLLVLLAWLMLFVNASVGNFAVRGTQLDERERAQRDRATAVAYRLLEAAIVIVTGYALVGTTWRLGLPEPSNAGQLMMFLIPIYFFALTLPIAVLAWTLPDPDPEPVSGAA
jgi:energy-coupling factor transporter transmembrane protein EcfT